MTQAINPVQLCCLYIYLFLFVLSSSISQASITPVTVYSNNIMDLYGSNLDVITAMAEQWSFNGQMNPGYQKTFVCGSQQYMGLLTGFSTSDSLEREYTGLSSHDILYYSVRVYALEGWQAADTITLTFDTTDVATWNPYTTITQEPQAFCGTGANDGAIFFSGKFFHTDSKLKIKLASSVTSGSTTATFAVRGIRIALGHKTATEVQAPCFKFDQRATTTNCYCEKDYFDAGSSTCTACFTGCNNCFGSTYTSCYGCKSGYSYDGTGCIQCITGCQLCTGSSANQCLVCSAANTLYWDGTCKTTTCTTPYVLQQVGDVKVCQTPCQPTGGYFLWNQQCSSVCDAPFVTRIEGNGKFCDYPCNSGASQFLSWDGTCPTTCVGYQRTENGYQFCDACQPGYFKYPDGTCLPTCAAPKRERVFLQSHFCESPCADSSQFYFPSNGQCKSECKYPYVIQDQVLCVYGIPEDEIGPLNSISEAMSVVSQVTGPVTAIAGLLSAGNPGAFCLATLSEMLHYIRYMKIQYPPKMQYILDQDAPEFISIIPEMTDSMLSRFPKHTLPEKFEEYGFPSSFIVNFWKPMISLLVYVVGGVTISSFLEATTTSCKFLNSIFRKLRKTLKWNLSIMIMISYYEDLVMATSFELRTVHFDSLPEILSFATCIIINVIGIFVIVRMFMVVWNLWKNRNKSGLKTSIRSQKLDVVKKGLRDYKVLFKENKEESASKQAFLCIFVAKVYLFYVIIAYPFDYPLLQTSLLTALSLIYVLYLIISRPLKSRIALAENFTQEVIILLVNVSALGLAILDWFENEDYDTRLVFGQIFVISDTVFGAFSLLFILLGLCESLIDIFVRIRLFLKNRKKTQAQINASATVVPYPSEPAQPSLQSVRPSKLPPSKARREKSNYPGPHSNRDYISSLQLSLNPFQPLSSSQSPEILPMNMPGSRNLNDSTVSRSRLLSFRNINHDFGNLDSSDLSLKNQAHRGFSFNSSRSNSRINKRAEDSRTLSFETRVETRRHQAMRSLEQEDESFQNSFLSPPLRDLPFQSNSYRTRMQHSPRYKKRRED